MWRKSKQYRKGDEQKNQQESIKIHGKWKIIKEETMYSKRKRKV